MLTSEASIEQEITLSLIAQYPLILPSTEGLGVYYTIQMAFSEQKLQPNIAPNAPTFRCALGRFRFWRGDRSRNAGQAHLPASVHAFKIKDTPARLPQP